MVIGNHYKMYIYNMLITYNQPIYEKYEYWGWGLP